jgi:hypothetical protein
MANTNLVLKLMNSKENNVKAERSGMSNYRGTSVRFSFDNIHFGE